MSRRIVMFVVNPILLGSGRPLLSGVPKGSKLKLLEAQGYQSGNVMLRYARQSSSPELPSTH